MNQNQINKNKNPDWRASYIVNTLHLYPSSKQPSECSFIKCESQSTSEKFLMVEESIIVELSKTNGDFDIKLIDPIKQSWLSANCLVRFKLLINLISVTYVIRLVVLHLQVLI